jgi:hypothetical protein
MGQLVKYCVGSGPVPVDSVVVGTSHCHEVVIFATVPDVGPATHDPSGQVNTSVKFAVMVTS